MQGESRQAKKIICRVQGNGIPYCVVVVYREDDMESEGLISTIQEHANKDNGEITL